MFRKKLSKFTELPKDFLADKPVLLTLSMMFLAFIGDSPLIIHNAEFDMKFINAELERCQRPSLPMSRAICTLVMAKKKFPGAGNSLDKLMRTFFD